MTREEFTRLTDLALAETHDALATVWNELNQGQQKKLLKNEEVAKVLKRYGVVE